MITDSSEINFSDNYKDSITTVVYSTINEEDINILFQNDEANILNLSFTSLNPEFAKHFSEIIIDEFLGINFIVGNVSCPQTSPIECNLIFLTH